jgi:hypothetical protein
MKIQTGDGLQQIKIHMYLPIRYICLGKKTFDFAPKFINAGKCNNRRPSSQRRVYCVTCDPNDDKK